MKSLKIKKQSEYPDLKVACMAVSTFKKSEEVFYYMIF